MTFNALKIILKIHEKLDLAHQITDANLYPLERQLTKASEPFFDCEGGQQGQS